MGLEVNPEVKDFLIGFPTLKHRNMGGFLLFSSDEKSMSTEAKMDKKKRERELVSCQNNGVQPAHVSNIQ